MLPEKLLIYHDGQLIAEHIRSYGRKGDFENPDHPRALLSKKHKAIFQKQLQRFLQLGEHSEIFYQEIKALKLNPQYHIKKILALSEVYSMEKVTQAISDAHEFGAYSCEYISNILEQRTRITEEPGPLHVTHSSDMLELPSPSINLKIYSEGGQV